MVPPDKLPGPRHGTGVWVSCFLTEEQHIEANVLAHQIRQLPFAKIDADITKTETIKLMNEHLLTNTNPEVGRFRIFQSLHSGQQYSQTTLDHFLASFCQAGFKYTTVAYRNMYRGGMLRVDPPVVATGDNLQEQKKKFLLHWIERQLAEKVVPGKTTLTLINKTMGKEVADTVEAKGYEVLFTTDLLDGKKDKEKRQKHLVYIEGLLRGILGHQRLSSAYEYAVLARAWHHFLSAAGLIAIFNPGTVPTAVLLYNSYSRMPLKDRDDIGSMGRDLASQLMSRDMDTNEYIRKMFKSRSIDEIPPPTEPDPITPTTF